MGTGGAEFRTAGLAVAWPTSTAPGAISESHRGVAKNGTVKYNTVEPDSSSATVDLGVPEESPDGEMPLVVGIGTTWPDMAS